MLWEVHKAISMVHTAQLKHFRVGYNRDQSLFLEALVSGPIISIVMPNFNGEKYLARAIQSFLSQEYAHKQLIIVDGISTDGSHAIIQQYASTNPQSIVWVREADQGLSDAINIGIAHSQGEMIGYLGNDDILYRGIIDEVAYHCTLIDVDVLYFDAYDYYVGQNRCVLRKPLASEFTRETLLRYGTIVALMNMFFRRRVLEKYKYDRTYKYAMDYELSLRITTQAQYLYLYVEKIATITVLDGGITDKFAQKQGDELVRAAKLYQKHNDDVWFSPKRSLHKRLFRRLYDLINKP